VSIADRVIAGDSITLSEPDAAAQYPAGQGWTLKFAFAPEQGGAAAALAALDASGQGSVASSVTAMWAPGRWIWSLLATKGSDVRITLELGGFTVAPDPLSATAADARSHARRVFDAINAAIEQRASATDLKVTLADGRAIERVSHSELLKLREVYARKVTAEERAAGGARAQRRYVMSF